MRALQSARADVCTGCSLSEGSFFRQITASCDGASARVHLWLREQVSMGLSVGALLRLVAGKVVWSFTRAYVIAPWPVEGG